MIFIVLNSSYLEMEKLILRKILLMPLSKMNLGVGKGNTYVQAREYVCICSFLQRRGVAAATVASMLKAREWDTLRLADWLAYPKT